METEAGSCSSMMLVAIVLAIPRPPLCPSLQLSISRQRNSSPTPRPSGLTRNPKGLADALQKISGDREVLEVANRAMTTSHSQP